MNITTIFGVAMVISTMIALAIMANDLRSRRDTQRQQLKDLLDMRKELVLARTQIAKMSVQLNAVINPDITEEEK